MLFIKNENKINNISLSNLQSITNEDNEDIVYQFNGFSITHQKINENNIEDYFYLLKSLEERYEIIKDKEFTEEAEIFLNKCIDEDKRRLDEEMQLQSL